MGDVVRFKKEQPGWNDFFKSEDSHVARYLKYDIARKIDILAKRMVGVKSHTLRNSIHIRMGKGVSGPTVMIGSPVKYAYYHHEGTKPHIIRANKVEFLHFRHNGHVIRTKQVNHPGTKPNKFLTIPMRTIVR